VLSADPPAPNCPATEFRHSFDDPVPTRGGAVLLPPDFPAGSFDQREIEARADVLVFTGEPLPAPLEVIGRIRVHLVASSTAAMTDWVVRLCDVDRDGVSWNIADGILRVHGADQAAEHVIDLWSTAYVFRPGHRIRVQVTSSGFPRWDRAPDARQRVSHDAVRPSRVVLPVVES
jgi:putative CocE/NonD family hydrolase